MFGNAIKEVDLLPQASVWTSALTGNEPLGNNPILCIEPTALLLVLLLVNAFLISSPSNRLCIGFGLCNFPQVSGFRCLRVTVEIDPWSPERGMFQNSAVRGRALA